MADEVTLEDALESYENKWGESGWDNYMYRHNGDVYQVKGLGDVHVVERHGGGEGDGEYMYVVLRIPSLGEDFYVKREGYYSSYDSNDWDGGEVFRVVPKTVSVTKFEKL